MAALLTSVAEPRAEEPKINCLLEPAEITNSGSGFGSFLRLEKFFKKKIMVANEFCVNYHNFNPIWVHNMHQSL